MLGQSILHGPWIRVLVIDPLWTANSPGRTAKQLVRPLWMTWRHLDCPQRRSIRFSVTGGRQLLLWQRFVCLPSSQSWQGGSSVIFKTCVISVSCGCQGVLSIQLRLMWPKTAGRKRGQRSWVLPLNTLGAACRAEDHGLGQTLKTNVILSPNLIASMMIEISKIHLSEFLDFIPSLWILLFVQWDVSCVYIFTEPAFEDESKPLFEDFLKKRGIEYWPTVANFIFCYFSEPVRLDARTEVVFFFFLMLIVGSSGFWILLMDFVGFSVFVLKCRGE